MISRPLPLLFLLSLTTTPAFAASLQLCPGAPVVSAGAVTADYITPDGKRLHAIVTEEPGKLQANCRTVPLTVAVQGVQAIHVLPRDARPGRTILLQGRQEDKNTFAITEHTLPSDAPERAPDTPMPFGASLLGTMQTRVFGAEQRVQGEVKDGRLQLACKAGNRPAGVVLIGPWYLPRAQAVVQAAFSGSGQFTLQAADAARAAREGALDLGRLDAAERTDTARFALPSSLDRAGWRQFTLLCPRQAASLTLDALTLEPAVELDRKRAPRSTWAWSPNAWKERGGELLDWAAGEKIGEVFITVPLEKDRVASPDALGAFIRQAGARGIAVSAVEGDPHMVLPEAQGPAATRARAYAAYNAGAQETARLKSVQFDVEPYLLPAHVLPSEQRDGAYLALVAALRQAAGKLPLEFVVPFWWHDKPDLLEGLARHADALTVMDYRTDPGQIYRFAVPFLDWGAEHGKMVRIALEAGPIGVETQRRYQRAAPGAKGDMLLFDIDGQKILLLLRVAAAHGQADAYTLGASRDIDGSATTFHADKDALRRLLPQLEKVFGAWKSFGGVALHELR